MADPSELGWSPGVFEAVDRLLVIDHPGVHSLLVCHRDRIVFERYYNGHNRDSFFDVRSVTKSVLSLLVGIAIGDGLLSLDSTLRDLVPDLLPADETRVGAIAVRHLLAMTAGFSWDDLGDFVRLVESDDWVSTVLHTPIVAAPGEVFTYNSGCSQLLSAILTRVTGESVLDFAGARLFHPLGIVPGAWPADPQGVTIGGFGLQLRARDMLKLGLLVLREGSWGDDQLVPVDYLRLATSSKSDGGFPEGTPYGYHWWTSREDRHEFAYAAGYGGQYICVIPGLQLTVATTAFWQCPPDDLSEPNLAIRQIIRAAPGA